MCRSIWCLFWLAMQVLKMTYESDDWRPIETAPRGRLVRVRGQWGKCTDAILDKHGQWMAKDYLLRGTISHIWFTPIEWMEIE